MSNIAVVTGARGALGQAVVTKLIEKNYEVIGLDRGTGNSNRLIPDTSISKLQWLDVDLTDHLSTKEAFDCIGKEKGTVHSLVHCAGGFRFSSLAEISDEDMDFLVSLNLKTPMIVAKNSLRLLNGKGRMVFVGAKAALETAGFGMVPYGATKAGLHSFVKGLASELNQTKINVNAVLPSVMDTPTNRKDMPDADFDSWVRPDEVATVIESLLSNWGNSVHGALITVGGHV